MFKKEIIIFALLLLSGCGSKVFACQYKSSGNTIDLEISAYNDDIKTIKVKTSYKLPNALILDETKFNEFKKQLNDEYHFESDNILVKESQIEINDNYSLQKTLDYLAKEHFYCE